MEYKMATWNYFRILALVWGAIAIITKPVLFNLFGKQWRAWLSQNAYSKGKRPAWILWAAIGSALLIGYTWYRVAVDAIALDWILAALMTVSSVKIITLLFDYTKFQEWVQDLFDNPKKETQMVISVTFIGLILIGMAFWLY
jgi:hypothetical protein